MRSLRLGPVALSFVLSLALVPGLDLVPALGARSASAQGATGPRAGGIGLGAESMVAGSGTPGDGVGISTAAFVYDRPAWHIAGLLGMSSAGDTDLFVGGRFFYHLHQGPMSDFSIGAGLGILSLGDGGGGGGPGGGDDRTDIVLEGATQIRAFVTSNVAIGASIGLGFVVIDEDNGDDYLVLGGQLMSAAGLWYFFQ